MATAPPLKLKSQQLHNFSFPDLKWGHKTLLSTSNHRDSLSPSRGQETQNNTSTVKTAPKTARNHHRSFTFSPCSKRKFQCGDRPENREKAGNDAVSEKETGTCEDGEVKPWNLRPRKVINFSIETQSYGDAQKSERNCITTTITCINDSNISRSARLRGGADRSGLDCSLSSTVSERKLAERKKLWISLSREEIEEDVYALSGSRPSRRPKKRNKTIQKHVDKVFPGMYLVGATADSYRGHDTLK